MIKNRRNIIAVWMFFGLIAASNLAVIPYLIPANDTTTVSRLASIFFPLVPVLFALIGALIISRQPQNIIGLLMMLPGLSFAFVIDAFLEPYISGQILPPTSPSPLFLLILWYSNWNWFLLVTPVLFIMTLFPSGRPLSRRWKSVMIFGLSIMLIFVFLVTFTEVIGPGSDSSLFQFPNPIGLLKIEWGDAIVGPLLILFAVWILLSASSLFVRFSRARGVERAQIKWLFYAGSLFVAYYFPTFIDNTYSQSGSILNLLLPIGLSTFPIAIAVAILRYRLYDIDLIVRRTVQYALITGLLAFFYFGGIVILQALFENLTGERDSPLITVISTLGIAALFNPLRLRIQDVIERRFYRKKYDAEQALTRFSVTARDEVDVDRFAASIMGLVDENLQPETVWLWLRPIGNERKRTG